MLVFTGVLGGNPAPVFGPVRQVFDKGAIILGISSGAYLAQDPSSSTNMPYPASVGTSRRDLFRLFLQWTDDEVLTPNMGVLAPVVGFLNGIKASINADPLMGEGTKNEFPRALLVPPSTGFDVSVQSERPAVNGNNEAQLAMSVHVVFHCMVPRVTV